MPSPTFSPLLSIGRDGRILEEREQSLRKAGYQVQSVKVESFIQQHIIEPNLAALFCQTLTSEECVFLATHFRRYFPENRLILLTAGDSYRAESILFHATVRSEDGPEALSREIGRLLEAA